MVLAYAVKDGRLAVNAAAGVSLPRVRQPEKRFRTHWQVAELAESCGPEYWLMVLFLAYTGLRWGEMAALRVHRVDFLRRRVLVAESVTPVKGVMTFGPTKGHERREVPIPRFLIADLAQHVAGKTPSDLVFNGMRGAALRYPVFQRGAQQMLGHKSAAMTLDQYGHLFGDRLDVVADAMDAARTSALADGYPVGSRGEVVGLRRDTK
jgi:integrase